MSNTTARTVTGIAIAAAVLVTGAGFTSATAGAFPLAQHHPVDPGTTAKTPDSVKVQGIGLPGIDPGGIEVGPNGVAISGPTVGLPVNDPAVRPTLGRTADQ